MVKKNIRLFRIKKNDGTLDGHYKGSVPAKVAIKICRALCKKMRKSECTFLMVDRTPNSKYYGKEYTYTCKRVKLTKPVIVVKTNKKTGKTQKIIITKKTIAKRVFKKKTQKGGCGGADYEMKGGCGELIMK